MASPPVLPLPPSALRRSPRLASVRPPLLPRTAGALCLSHRSRTAGALCLSHRAAPSSTFSSFLLARIGSPISAQTNFRKSFLPVSSLIRPPNSSTSSFMPVQSRFSFSSSLSSPIGSPNFCGSPNCAFGAAGPSRSLSRVPPCAFVASPLLPLSALPDYVRATLPPLVAQTPTWFPTTPPASSSPTSPSAPVLNLDQHGKPLTFRSALAGPFGHQWRRGNGDELIKLVETSRCLTPVHFATSLPTYLNNVVKEKWFPRSSPSRQSSGH